MIALTAGLIAKVVAPNLATDAAATRAGIVSIRCYSVVGSARKMKPDRGKARSGLGRIVFKKLTERPLSAW
jgi:hypothetical protein